MAIYNYDTQNDEFAKSRDPNDKPTEQQKIRAAVAQSFLFRLGLNPSPKLQIGIGEKRGLAALVGKLEQARKGWQAAFDESIEAGNDGISATIEADKVVKSDFDFRKDLETGSSRAGCDLIRNAFSIADQSGNQKPIPFTGKTLSVYRPATTNVEKCMTLTDVRDLMAKAVQQDAAAAAKATGQAESVYNRVEFLVDPDVTFDEYQEAYQAALESKAPDPKRRTIYDFRAAAAGGQPAAGEESIYGRWEKRIDPVTDPATEGPYEAISAPFEGAP